MRLEKARRNAGISFGTTDARTSRCPGNFRARARIHAEVASFVEISPVTRTGPREPAVAHFSRELPASIRRKVSAGMLLSREADADFLHPARVADDLDRHRRAADLAVLDSRVIALRGIGHRGNDLPA